MIDAGIDGFSFAAELCRHGGKSFRRPDQQILQRRCLRALSTDTGFCTAGAAGSFLTLVAKHVLFHKIVPPVGYFRGVKRRGKNRSARSFIIYTYRISDITGKVCGYNHGKILFVYIRL